MQLATVSLLLSILFTLAPLGELVEVNPAGLKGLVPWSSPEVSVQQHGGVWVVAFTAGTGPSTAIHLRTRSQSDGSWSQTRPISPVDKTPDSQPSLWIDSKGNFHCVWTTKLTGKRGHQVFYSRLLAGEQEWSSPHLLSTGWGAVPAQLLGDAHGNLVVCNWNNSKEHPKGRIQVFVSRDGGFTWKESDPNFPAEERKGKASALQVRPLPDGSLGLLWLDHSPGGVSVVFNRGTEAATQWLHRPVAVNSDRSYAAGNPRLIVSGDRIHAVWTVRWLREDGPRIQLWTAHSLDWGRNFSQNRLLYEASGESVEIELFEGEREQVGIVWAEKLPPESNRMPPGGRIQEMIFWDGSSYLESPGAHEMSRSSTHLFSDLKVAGKGERRLVLASDLNPFEPSRVLVFSRNGLGGWSSMTLEAKTPTYDARRPIAFVEASDPMYTVVFHEMRRSRFIMEPPPSDTTILWGQYRFQGGSGITR